MPYIAPADVRSIRGKEIARSTGPASDAEVIAAANEEMRGQDRIYQILLYHLNRINNIQFISTLFNVGVYTVIVILFLRVPSHKRVKRERADRV